MTDPADPGRRAAQAQMARHEEFSRLETEYVIECCEAGFCPSCDKLLAECVCVASPRPGGREAEVGMMKKVTEVRVITHGPNAPAAHVALIFSDGTTSAFLNEFDLPFDAENFADGVREGLKWAAALEVGAAGKSREGS